MSVNVHLNLVILVDAKCILGRLSSAGWLLEIANPLCHIPNYKLLSKESKAWWTSLWAVFTFTQVFCWEPPPPHHGTHGRRGGPCPGLQSWSSSTTDTMWLWSITWPIWGHGIQVEGPLRLLLVLFQIVANLFLFLPWEAMVLSEVINTIPVQSWPHPGT